MAVLELEMQVLANAEFTLCFTWLYFGRAPALISGIMAVLRIEPCLECTSSSLSQGQIVYHPSGVKVGLFIGRTDPSWLITRPPGRKRASLR